MRQILNREHKSFLSVVIPVYNSSASLGLLMQEIESALKGHAFEIIFVNDCSSDGSMEILREMAAGRTDITVIDLARNFGQHNALMAGMRHARGDILVLMDDDLQHPPSEIPGLIGPIEDGAFDVVYAGYKKANMPWFRIFVSKVNDVMATLLLGKPSGLYFCSFKAMRSFVAKEITQYSGAYPYIDGLIFRSTTKIGSVFVQHRPRVHGTSNYNLRKLFCLWLNMFTNFSILPLRLAAFAGFIMSVTAFCFAVYIFIMRSSFSEVQRGWASLMFSIMLLAGVQLASIGLLGEYLGRAYLTVNQTPQYVVREVIRTIPGEEEGPLWEQSEKHNGVS